MEYFISKSNFSDFFPNLLNGIHLGCIRRNENNTDFFRDDQRVRLVLFSGYIILTIWS